MGQPKRRQDFLGYYRLMGIDPAGGEGVEAGVSWGFNGGGAAALSSLLPAYVTRNTIILVGAVFVVVVVERYVSRKLLLLCLLVSLTPSFHTPSPRPRR